MASSDMMCVLSFVEIYPVLLHLNVQVYREAGMPFPVGFLFIDGVHMLLLLIGFMQNTDLTDVH
jgi:hypothetical protein